MAVAGFRHLGLKVVSIGLAALLWLVVAGEQIVERALRIPLEYTNLPARLELVGEPPTAVDVRVRGSSGALSRIAPGELAAVLDLKDARPGQRLFHLGGREVRSPFGVEVVQVTPSSLSFTFEASDTRIVPILPGIEGQPADGFVVGTVVADPSTVSVVGPVSAVKRLTEAITEPLSIEGASAAVTEVLNVGVTDPSVRLTAPQTTRVRVNIAAAPVEWAIAGIAVKVLQGRPDVTVQPTEVTVHVRGPRAALGATAADFDASVDVGGLNTGRYQLPVRVMSPDRVAVVSVVPAEVNVRVR